ncbi:MAG: hypothetical protein JNJ71_00945 [Rubrivivax sp.]|nr:hypothetical protein [Rubrivivax sp.]
MTPRRRFLRHSAPLLAAPWLASCSKGASQPAPPGMPRLGINLAETVDWNTELPFIDFFRMSREWISQLPTGDWGKGPKLALDEQGWIKSLEPGHWADTPMCTATGSIYPQGNYKVSYEGAGEIDFWGSGRVIASAPGSLTVEVTPSRGPIWLRLKKTDPANPVRNIRVLRPGYEPAATPHNAFHPGFLERWQGVACVRFMDWMHTNNSRQSAWKDRPTPQEATFSVKGTPVELMVDLVNRLEADAWFCMPHGADDEYVQQFAKLVKAQLKPTLKVYLEFSNELWNGQFQQARDAQMAAQAAKMGLGQWISQRSVQLFSTWEQAFGGRERLVRVMPSQAANKYLSDEMLKHRDGFKSCDALAIAPYLSLNLPPDKSGGASLSAAEVEAWSVDMLLDHLESQALPECIGWMKAQKAVADQYGVKLVAYEGGQHLVGIFGAENRDNLTRLLHAANAHPRMGVLYQRYFDAWAELGGDLHCHFNSVAQWSKWGSWGLLQYAEEDPAKSPKFMASLTWARRQGQKVRVPGL